MIKKIGIGCGALVALGVLTLVLVMVRAAVDPDYAKQLKDGAKEREIRKRDAEVKRKEQEDAAKIRDRDAEARRKEREVAANADRDKKALELAEIRLKNAAIEEAARNPHRNITMQNFDWSKSGFGSIMMASFRLKNENGFAVKDIAITCGLFAKSGTQLSTARQVIYEIIPAKSTRTFREVNLGFINQQSAQANCKLTDAARAE